MAIEIVSFPIKICDFPKLCSFTRGYLKSSDVILNVILKLMNLHPKINGICPDAMDHAVALAERG
jgi:hypothetical protein